VVLSNTYPYVCEHSCGNGVVEPGEECELGDAGCLPTCVRARPCTEAGGRVSTGTGHCFFLTGSNLTYDQAKAACPAGTHLATLESPTEAEAATLAVGATPAWIALRATTTLGILSWDAAATIPFDPGRYHNFDVDEPNDTTLPQCARVEVGGLWRDRTCGASSTYVYAALCERD
jgi:hypothetical protein